MTIASWSVSLDRTLPCASHPFDFDSAPLGLLRFGQGQRQDAVLHLGLDLFLVDAVRSQAKAPAKVPMLYSV